MSAVVIIIIMNCSNLIRITVTKYSPKTHHTVSVSQYPQ